MEQKYPTYWHYKVDMPTAQADALRAMLVGEPVSKGFVKVDSACFKKIFDINRQYLYHGDFTAPSNETDFVGSVCYLTNDALSGFCLTKAGWLTCVFSNSSTGNFLNHVASLVKGKVKALVCIISDVTGDYMVTRYAELFDLHVCATTVDDSEKFASFYGVEFANFFTSCWGRPKHVFMTKKDFSDKGPIPHIYDYFDAKQYVDNLLNN